MRYIFKYKNKDYYSIYSLRQEIYKQDRIAFGKAPEKGTDTSNEDFLVQLNTFWNPLGVTVEKAPEPEPYVPSDEDLAQQIRAQRDNLLNVSDKYMLADYPRHGVSEEEILAYRKALRDITIQETFPKEVTWPEDPIAKAIEQEKQTQE